MDEESKIKKIEAAIKSWSGSGENVSEGEDIPQANTHEQHEKQQNQQNQLEKQKKEQIKKLIKFWPKEDRNGMMENEHTTTKEKFENALKLLKINSIPNNFEKDDKKEKNQSEIIQPIGQSPNYLMKEGFLYLLQGEQWNLFWFILDDSNLFCFQKIHKKSYKDQFPLHYWDLRTAVVTIPSNYSYFSKENSFRCFFFILQIQKSDNLSRIYHLATQKEYFMFLWIHSLETAIFFGFYLFLIYYFIHLISSILNFSFFFRLLIFLFI